MKKLTTILALITLLLLAVGGHVCASEVGSSLKVGNLVLEQDDRFGFFRTDFPVVLISKVNDVNLMFSNKGGNHQRYAKALDTVGKEYQLEKFSIQGGEYVGIVTNEPINGEAYFNIIVFHDKGIKIIIDIAGNENYAANYEAVKDYLSRKVTVL